MKTIYIDYTSSAPVKSATYHGGGNYTNYFLFELQKRKRQEIEVILLWPSGYKPRDGFETTIYNSEYFKIESIKSLDDSLSLKPNSTLFLPQLYRPFDFKAVRKIKKINPTVRVVATVHDLATQYNRYDILSHYYFTGWKYYLYFIHKPGRWFLNTFINKPKIKSGLKTVDLVFTDSNFSLQQITDFHNNVNIVPHYISPLPRVPNSAKKSEHNYFLFVSGNRPRKNFLRTLIAFCDYKNKYENDYHLYVTGLSEQTLNNMCRYSKINKDIVRNYVRAFDYVDDETLDNLFKNCTLLLYTSKFEGFGLPILEAARYGRPSISSHATSIPEVLGSCTRYINPYSATSIFKGIVYMTQEHILKQYEKWLAELYPILEQRMKYDFEVALKYIME